METKEYYEINLPGYLQHDLDAMKKENGRMTACGENCMVPSTVHLQMGILQKIMPGICEKNIWIWKEFDLLTRWIPSGRRVT